MNRYSMPTANGRAGIFDLSRAIMCSCNSLRAGCRHGEMWRRFQGERSWETGNGFPNVLPGDEWIVRFSLSPATSQSAVSSRFSTIGDFLDMLHEAMHDGLYDL